MRNSVALLLILILAVSSLIMAIPTFAQIPTPSVPEFTVQGVGPSYTVPTTYSLDSATGQIVAQIGYTVEYSYIVVTIKNQPFTSSDAGNGFTTSFFYDIQTKLHSSEDWNEWYNPYDGYPTQGSDSENTVLSYSWDGSHIVTPSQFVEIPSGGQVDFQVKAMIGYVSRVFNPNATSQLGMYPWVFTGQTSGWSNVQTLTLPANIPLSPTPTPSSSPSPFSTPTPTPTLSPTPAPISTAIPSSSPTKTSTPTPSNTPTQTPTPTQSSSPNPSPNLTPSPTPTQTGNGTETAILIGIIVIVALLAVNIALVIRKRK